MLIISIPKTFPVSKQVADIMPFKEVCPHFYQVPSKQAVIYNGSSSSTLLQLLLLLASRRICPHQPQLNK
jgi:hypothetical protein